MKLKRLISGACGFLIFGMALLFSDVLFAYNIEEYYPLSESSTWTYSFKTNENGVESTEKEITKIKGTEKIGEIETKKMVSAKIENQCIAIDLEGVKLYKAWGWSGMVNESDMYNIVGDYDVYNPPKMLFPNLEIGESRTYPIKIETHTIDDDVTAGRPTKSGTLTITLAAVEEVEVPAGKFKDCLKFISVLEYKKIQEAKSRDIKEITDTWLAPGIGRVKANYTNTTTEYNLDTKTKKEETFKETLELIESSVK